MAQRRFQVAAPLKKETQIVMPFGEVRADGKGGFEMRDSVVVSAEILQDEGQVAMHLADLRRECDRPSDQFGGFYMFLSLMRDETQQMQRVVMVRQGVQNLRVDRLRVVQTPALWC